MKRIFSLLALVFVSSLILYGCDQSTNEKKGNDVTTSIDGNKVNDPTTSIDGNKVNDATTSIDGNKVNDATTSIDGNKVNDEASNADGSNNSETADNNQSEFGTEIGDRIKNVTLEILSGSSISLDDYKGKILVLNIWATWCPPCKMELPDFDRVATEYKDDVIIIAAHTPSGSENAQSYVDLNFPATDIIFAYDTPDSQAYLAAGGEVYVPQTAIIDKNGIIVYSDSGIMSYDDLTRIIDGLLAN